MFLVGRLDESPVGEEAQRRRFRPIGILDVGQQALPRECFETIEQDAIGIARVDMFQIHDFGDMQAIGHPVQPMRPDQPPIQRPEFLHQPQHPLRVHFVAIPQELGPHEGQQLRQCGMVGWVVDQLGDGLVGVRADLGRGDACGGDAFGQGETVVG